MEMANQPVAPAATPEPTLGVWSRTVAVFARPAHAWAGLERRPQWWFPMLVSVLVSVVGTSLIYERAIVPTQLEQFERQVESGQLPPEAMDRVEAQVAGPVARVFSLVAIVVGVPLMTLAFALLPWISAGFLLGKRFRYRDAFAVTAWSGLVAIPSQLLSYALGWWNESMSAVHVGFGALLPAQDPPSKLMIGLGTFLDQGIGPFALWYVAVLALGAATLSGADRRSAVVTTGLVWLGIMVIVAVLAGLFGPGV